MTKPVAVNDTSGSPDQRIVSAFHKKSDVNSSRDAQHHTIGAGIYQVASGKHNHIDDGQPLFDPSNDVLSGSLSGATATVLGQVCALLAKLGATNGTSP